MRNYVKITIILIGVSIVIQSSDVNPFLLIEPYRKWLNRYVFRMNYPNLDLCIIMGCNLIGSLVVCLPALLNSRNKKIV